MGNINHRKVGARIGAKELVFAVLTSDDSTGASYESDLHHAPGLIEIGMTASIAEEVLGADDNPMYDMYSALDSVEVNMTVAALGTSLEEILLGRTRDNNGVLISKSDDIAPWVAMGFKSAGTDGSHDYVWLYKGKFKQGDSTYRSKERGAANFQTPSLVGTFGPRDYDGHLIARVNDHDPDLASGVIAGFLSSVYGAAANKTIVSAAAYSVTAPVKSATPQSTHVAGTGYTAAIAWTPNDGTFSAETEYAATVTLTAAAGYVFDPSFGVTDITGLPTNALAISVTRASATSVVIQVTYPDTAA